MENILIRCWDSDRALVRKYSPARPRQVKVVGRTGGQDPETLQIRRSARARSHARTQSSHSEGFLCSFSWRFCVAKDRRDWMDKHPCGISASFSLLACLDPAGVECSGLTGTCHPYVVLPASPCVSPVSPPRQFNFSSIPPNQSGPPF